jgi:hypothetical protein
VYFGGRLFEADGWDTKMCRVCGKDAKDHFHVHHVFGNQDHSRLVILCPGCHDAISKLASRKSLTEDMMMKVVWFAIAQKIGVEPKWMAAEHEQPHVEIRVSR